MYNKVIMMGRLVADPDFKTTPTGLNVASYRIAVDRRFTPKGEEKKSDFFNVVSWRQQADFVHRYFTKGRLILVEGELNTRTYQDKNGNTATWYEIVTDRVSFTGEKSQSGAYSDTFGTPPPPPPPPPPPQYSGDNNGFAASAAPVSSPAPAAADTAVKKEVTADDFAATDDDYPF